MRSRLPEDGATPTPEHSNVCSNVSLSPHPQAGQIVGRSSPEESKNLKRVAQTMLQIRACLLLLALRAFVTLERSSRVSPIRQKRPRASDPSRDRRWEIRVSSIRYICRRSPLTSTLLGGIRAIALPHLRTPCGTTGAISLHAVAEITSLASRL